MRLTDRSTWKALAAHAREAGDIRILDLFSQDPQRALAFSIEACGLLLDYSKNPVSAETRRLLVALAEEAGVPAQIAAMFEGRRINVTENRAVLHTALRNRSQRPVMVDGQDVMPGIRGVLERMRGMAERAEAAWAGQARHQVPARDLAEPDPAGAERHRRPGVRLDRKSVG